MFSVTFLLVSFLSLLGTYFAYLFCYSYLWNPLQAVAGPPVEKLFSNPLNLVLNPFHSYRTHNLFVQKYGRSIRIQGLGPLDQRLLTLDPVSVAHVLKNSQVYEKPWQSRRMITSLIGCGMLAAEGLVHKRQRRVCTPAFSIQNLRAIVPLVFVKGQQLKMRWLQMMPEKRATLDVCHWISRATFDVIGVAGFEYDFNAIQDETNELFLAYKEMFEVAISQGNSTRNVIRIYAPWLDSFLPDDTYRTIERCQGVIRRVAGQLVQEKKAKIQQGELDGKPHAGRDLLSLLLKSNSATELPVDQRISDEDILHNINTFMFAGSDTSSLSLTWTLYLLAQHPTVQTRLRNDLLGLGPTSSLDTLSEDEIQSLYAAIADHPLLHNVVREAMRLIPPVHSSIRVATQDDEIPTSYPVHGRNSIPLASKSIRIAKGSFVHVAVEGFSLDKEFWGEDAWEFQPDRWDHLPEEASSLPGLFSNILAFSAGPRSCIGMRFSMIEIKTFLYILLTSFVFEPTDDRIMKANVVLTRPYIVGKYKQGSQLPLVIKPVIL